MPLPVIIAKTVAAAIILQIGVIIRLIIPITRIALLATQVKPLQAITVICALTATIQEPGLITTSTILVLSIVYPVILLHQITIAVNVQNATQLQIGVTSSLYTRVLTSTVLVAIRHPRVTGRVNVGIVT